MIRAWKIWKLFDIIMKNVSDIREYIRDIKAVGVGKGAVGWYDTYY